MNQQRIKDIYELLETIKEALNYLSTNDENQVRADVQAGRKFVTDLMEHEANRPIRGQIDADKLSDEDWLQEMYRVLDDMEHPLPVQNFYDDEFQTLIQYIWNTDTESMVSVMKNRLDALGQTEETSYKTFVEYFSRFSLWGSFLPEEGDYTTFELRAKELKQRSYEFLWLYKRMEDYLSKRTLYSILLNWTFMDIFEIKKVKSPFADYYEPDIFPHNNGDVFVDAGAYIGDSIHQYIKIYGTMYSKIYAYEISEDTCKTLYENTKDYHDVIIRQKGAGKEKGYMTLVENADASANKTEAFAGSSEKKVEIVTLDEELEKEGVTFIKMDIEGAEQDALSGCKNLIQKNHPKLAICTYHGYEDIWKIPSMIDAMNPEYKFYMRHYGGNLVPTEFVLLCK